MLRASPALLAVLLIAAPASWGQPPPEKPWSLDLFRELSDPLRTAPSARASLDRREREADRYFRALRDAEIARYRASRRFPGAQPFYRGKVAIESSPVFSILRRMPKGSALHVHSSAAGRARWIVSDATYRPHCYVYWPEIDPGLDADPIKGQLGFFAPGQAPSGYRLTAEVRKTVPDFDRQLLGLLTLGPEDEAAGDIWAEFGACFQRLGNVLGYRPVFRDYFADAFRTLAADQVEHVELRIPLSCVSELDGRCWSGVSYVDEYLRVRDDVRRDYPNFSLKLIVAGSRYDDIASVLGQLTRMIPLRVCRPEHVVGYDLVGEEDGGYPTIYYAGILLYAKILYDCILGVGLPLYLHDGESNWKSDVNLRSAFELFTGRVGHGLNLHFFPRLERHFIARPIPLEVCPISNQLLGYVADLRIHPAEGYVRRGVICALSSDDPAIFGNDGLSYDFWEATMSWQLGLAELKQLAINSIESSARTREEKDRALNSWRASWRNFIESIGP